MQIHENTGNIDKGTISVSLSKAEVGYKNILFVMDYHRIDKNKYSISLFVQEKGNDMYYICDDRDIESRYSELEQLMKDITYKSLKQKILQNFCKIYMKEVENMCEIKSITTGVLMIASEEGEGYPFFDSVKIAQIQAELKNAKEDLGNIHFCIDYREPGEWGEWETFNCSLSGRCKDLIEFLEQLWPKVTLSYEAEITYDSNYTNMLLRFMAGDKQEEVKLSIRNSSKFMTEKLENYILKRSYKVVRTNNRNEVMNNL